jgi:hypothetical protein
LGAYARLCEQIAKVTLSEETATALMRMASDCDRVARQVADKMSGALPPTRH